MKHWKMFCVATSNSRLTFNSNPLHAKAAMDEAHVTASGHVIQMFTSQSNEAFPEHSHT